MNTYKIALFGHRDICAHKAIEKSLRSLLGGLMREKTHLQIYIGRDGEFDIFAASVVKQIQEALGKESSEMILVLPYKRKDIEYLDGYYDSVIIPDCLCNLHPKSAISRRNRWMVEICDLIIGYIENSVGGAYAAVKYAKKLNKPLINLADQACDE